MARPHSVELPCSPHASGAPGVPVTAASAITSLFCRCEIYVSKFQEGKNNGILFHWPLKYALFQKVESINITGNVGMMPEIPRLHVCLGQDMAAAPVDYGLRNIAIGHLLEILSPLKNMTPFRRILSGDTQAAFTVFDRSSFVAWPEAQIH